MNSNDFNQRSSGFHPSCIPDVSGVSVPSSLVDTVHNYVYLLSSSTPRSQTFTQNLRRFNELMHEMREIEESLKQKRSEVIKTGQQLLAEAQNPHSVFPLDADTTDRLLTFLPNFSTLLSFILTAKSVHTIFKARPQSIIRAVAYNQIGPALPQALRLARCQAAHLVQRTVDELPNEGDIMNQEILREEARILALNAGVVIEWEALFSWRKKDRTLRESQLSQVESLRFHQTMYRIWLLSYTYGMGSISEEVIDDTNSYGVDDEPGRRRISDDDVGGEEEYTNEDEEFGYDSYSKLQEYRLKQKGFLNRFTTAELYAIRAIALFLREISVWVVGAEGDSVGSMGTYDFDGLYLFAGPRIILQCYRGVTTTPLPWRYLDDDGPYEGFLSKPLKEILEERGIPLYQEDLVPSRNILDHINGEDDKCRYCDSACGIIPGMKQGVSLYNETNWDYLKGNLLLDLRFHVKGKLLANRTEAPLRKALYNMDYSTLMHQMFDSRRGTYRDWLKEEWACLDCLCEFFRETLPFWWLNRKREAGTPIMRDCWYGYDCHLQGYDSGLEHAQRFNHLCEPTRKLPAGATAYGWGY